MKHILLTIFFVSFFFSSKAQQWEPVKDTLLESKSLNGYQNFIHHKNYLYFFTQNAIYRSSNHGEDWESVNSNQGTFYTTIVSNGQFLYTTSEKGTVIKSEDGVEWTPLNHPFKELVLLTSINNRIFVIATDKGAPSLQYSDDGELWYQIEIPSQSFEKLIYNREYPFCFTDPNNNLYYAEKDSSFKSVKISGRDWIFKVGRHLFSLQNDYDFSDTLKRFDPKTAQWTIVSSTLDSLVNIQYVDTILFVKTLSTAGEYKILRSTDLGASWVAIKTGDEAEKENLFLPYGFGNSSIASGKNLFKGGFISRDLGKTWTFNKRGYYGKQKIYFSGKNFFVDSPTGISVSKDRGKTWEPVSLPDTLIYPDKFFLLKEGHVAITGYDGQIYYSSNHGESWIKVKIFDQYYEYEHGEDRHQFRELISVKLIGEYLNVRVEKVTIDAYIHREFQTNDFGKTWTEISNHFPVQEYYRDDLMPYFNKDSIFYGLYLEGVALLIKNSNASQWTWFYAKDVLPFNYQFEQIFDGGDKVLVTAFRGGGLQSKIYKLYEVSKDGSLKELPVSNMPEPPFSYIHATDSNIYIVGRHDIRKLKSNDDTWTTLSIENLPDNIITTNAVFHEGTIYLATENGIWKLDEGGILAIKNSPNTDAALLYPNPAKESFLLHIQGNVNDKPNGITILDLNGRELKRYDYLAGGDYNISDLPKGLYVVQLFYPARRTTIKFAKD